MNFYKHHLGDYANATAHLTWEEDMSYTRLLRAYYSREAAIPAPEVYRLVRATSKVQRAAVDSVLAEFFSLQDGAWHNKRADEEITAYQAQAETNRRIANTRKGRRTVDESLHEPYNEPSTKRTPNQNQIPEPDKRKTNTRRFRAGSVPGFDAFYAAYPRHENRKAAEVAWAKLAPDDALQARILSAIAAQQPCGCLRETTTSEGRSTIPHPASWLNARRWEDEAAAPKEPRFPI